MRTWVSISLHIIAGVCFLSALLLLYWQLAPRFIYEWLGPLNWDVVFYLTIGRGLLNGLIPYLDLYEPKPPGIFLLSALSLYLYNSPKLGSVIEAFSLFVYPLVLAVAVWQLGGASVSKPYRLFLCTVALVFGAVFALYAPIRADEYQTEVFGSLFGAIYIALAALPSQMKIWRLFLLSLALMCTVGLKEPFLLSALGGIIVLYGDNLKVLKTHFIAPLIIAATLGVLIMAIIGVLIPYFQIYLQIEFFERLHTELLGTRIDRTWPELWAYYKGLEHHSKFMPLLIGLVLISALVRPLWLQQSLMASSLTIIATIFAIIITAYALLVKGTWGQHAVFAVPLYIGAGLVILKDASNFAKLRKISRILITLNVIFLALLSTLILSNRKPLNDPVAAFAHRDREIIHAISYAHYLDEIIDRCQYEHRFFYLGGNGVRPIMFMKHSPMGPLFIQFPYWFAPQNAYFRERFLHNLYTASIMTYNPEYPPLVQDLDTTLKREIHENFTTTVPACAASVVGVVDHQLYPLLYRKDLVH